MGWLKIQKLEYLENGTEPFSEIKMYLKWHILRSYRFVAEVTFKSFLVYKISIKFILCFSNFSEVLCLAKYQAVLIHSFCGSLKLYISLNCS